MSGGGDENADDADNTFSVISRTVFLQKVILTLREDDTTFGRTTKTMTALLEQGCSPEAAVSALHTVCGSRKNGSVMRTISRRSSLHSAKMILRSAEQPKQ